MGDLGYLGRPSPGGYGVRPFPADQRTYSEIIQQFQRREKVIEHFSPRFESLEAETKALEQGDRSAMAAVQTKQHAWVSDSIAPDRLHTLEIEMEEHLKEHPIHLSDYESARKQLIRTEARLMEIGLRLAWLDTANDPTIPSGAASMSLEAAGARQAVVEDMLRIHLLENHLDAQYLKP